MLHKGDKIFRLDRLGDKRQGSAPDAVTEEFFIRVSRHEDNAQTFPEYAGAHGQIMTVHMRDGVETEANGEETNLLMA